MNKDDMILYFMLSICAITIIAVITLFGFGINEVNEQRARCQSLGGQYQSIYRSSDLCWKDSNVLYVVQ